MKVLVAYFSKTGNTEKIARAIHEGIEQQAAKDIFSMKDVKGLDEYDLIFCGFPVHAHSVPGPAEAFIKTIPEGKNVAFFATHGSLRGGPLAITAMHHALGLVPKSKIVGTFGCRGAVSHDMIDALMEKPEHKWWAMEAQSAVGHPDQADIEDAREFASLMVAKVRRGQSLS